jgi:hypothetical protein
MATGYGLGDGEVAVRVPVGSKIFSSPGHPDRFWGPPSLLSNGYQEAFLLEAKRPGLEADHSFPTSEKIKEMWIYTSALLYVFMV